MDGTAEQQGNEEQGVETNQQRVSEEAGFADGIRCDTDGNVWCGWGWGGMETNGVRVHHPDGTLLAFLHTPEVIANLCFGGTKRNRLFMCGSTSIYALYVNAQGHALS